MCQADCLFQNYEIVIFFKQLGLIPQQNATLMHIFLGKKRFLKTKI